MTQDPLTPLDVALDLLVYVPVGLALTAVEELPKLAEKGRSRVTNQISIARVVGQFAVARGRQTLENHFSPPPAPAPPRVVAPEPGPAANFEEMAAGFEDGASASPPPSNGSGPVPDPAAEPVAAAGPAPSAAELAIPGYDSLSASQVVLRLAGLGDGELTAVGAYEQAHRGRRTIWNRVDQLQGP